MYFFQVCQKSDFIGNASVQVVEEVDVIGIRAQMNGTPLLPVLSTSMAFSRRAAEAALETKRSLAAFKESNG